MFAYARKKSDGSTRDSTVSLVVENMDPASARAMACTAKRPLSRVFEVIKESYLEEHRSRSLLDMTPEPPYNRCIMAVTNGRCRKTVSGVALTQYCWKHQPGGGICCPGDSTVCSWNFNGVLQRTERPA